MADPPAYHDAVQTRPFLDVNAASPPTQQLLVVYTNNTTGVPITVPVRSEDAGELLFAYFFLDYGVPQAEDFLSGTRLPASTYEDTKRSVSYQWLPRSTSSGCHLLTLVVAHLSSFDAKITDHLTTEGAQDAAIVNWWVNVNPSPDKVHDLSNCPVSLMPGQ